MGTFPLNLAFRVLFRVHMADKVRFNLRAIKTFSIFEASSPKSSASSAGVHARPLGRGPSSFPLRFQPEFDQAADGFGTIEFHVLTFDPFVD
jgi:hypothetical protein